MKIPKKLYRYRSLSELGDNSLLDRELLALEKAYLFSPSFTEMNDPMEAFYEMGSAGDRLLDIALNENGKSIEDIYAIIESALSEFCLLSFSTSNLNYPLWAYYADNFSGICLEFDTAELTTGGLDTEFLREVKYVKKPPQPISFTDISNSSLREKLTDHLFRKRIDWQHEAEWRLLTVKRGAKHYFDDALSRVFIGPRAPQDSVERICKTLKGRPTQILRGQVQNYSMHFNLIQAAAEFPEPVCEEKKEFDPKIWEYDRTELTQFFEDPELKNLCKLCDTITLGPNVKKIDSVLLSSSRPGTVCITIVYCLRNGQTNTQNRYYTKELLLAH